MKLYNFNRFFRFNGGVPNRLGKTRGNALGESGELISAEHTDEIRGSGSKLEVYTNREDVRANTNFYKHEKEIYSWRKTYFQNEVEDFVVDRTKWIKFFLGSFLCLYLFVDFVNSDSMSAQKRRRAIQRVPDDLFDEDGFLIAK